MFMTNLAEYFFFFFRGKELIHNFKVVACSVFSLRKDHVYAIL